MRINLQLLNRYFSCFKNITFLKLTRFCIYAFCVFVLFQTKLFFQTNEIYSSGYLNLYTNFFLYVSDIFLIFAFIFLGFSYIYEENTGLQFKFGDRKLFALLLGIVFLIELSAFWASSSFQAFIAMIRFVEYLLFYLFFINANCSVRFLVKLLLFVFVLQALIGIFQYVFQSSLGLSFFGEPFLSKDVPGVSKVDLGSMKFLRSYGTFAHPNIFGGFLVFGIILAFSRLSEDKFLYLTLISVMLVALVLTFSRSAWLALLIASAFYVFVTRPKLKVKYIFLGILVFLLFLVAFDLDKLFLSRVLNFDDASVSKRIEYTQISKNMLLAHPFGVGVGNFTLEMQSFTDQKLPPWDLQPVHNIFLLSANEASIFIFPIFVYLLVYIFISVLKKSQQFVSGGDRRYGILLLCIFFAFLTISNLDHYPFSLYQGQFLFFFYLLLVNDFVLRRTSV